MTDKPVNQLSRIARRLTLAYFRKLFVEDPNKAVRDAHVSIGPEFTEPFSRHLVAMGRSQAFERTIKELFKRPKVVSIDSYRPRPRQAFRKAA